MALVLSFLPPVFLSILTPPPPVVHRLVLVICKLLILIVFFVNYSMLYVLVSRHHFHANMQHIDAHAIYLLNLLLAFLQPKFDPSLQDDLMADEIEEGVDSGAASPLPSQRDDEFRPFVRRLPEWQFWSVYLTRLILSYSFQRLGFPQREQLS